MSARLLLKLRHCSRSPFIRRSTARIKFISHNARYLHRHRWMSTLGSQIDSEIEPSIKRRKITSENEMAPPSRISAQKIAPHAILQDQHVRLTEVESKLQSLLLDVCEYIHSQNVKSQSTTPAPIELRFTGGWVRDKILGVESHDIDVAINTMTGYAFALQMVQFLEIAENASKYQIDTERGSGGLHKIKANPEKSKHLETVTTKLFGLDLDFVNLRKETYTEESRNPQMDFGTPEEDALRRDATINAMFYNLQTAKIEDLTGKGFDDIKKGIIRTPLEPYQTFKDDPLRILRLIRFASRLGYLIDPAAEEAMANSEVKHALRLKISRERIGVEIEKMLHGPDPVMALSLVERLRLYEDIFTNPSADIKGNPEIGRLKPAYDVVSSIVDARKTVNHVTKNDAHQKNKSVLEEILIRDINETYIAWILACTMPWSGVPTPEPNKPGRKATPVVTTVVREGIKATNKVCDVTSASKENFEDIQTVQQRFIAKKRHPLKSWEGEDATARNTLGMAVRKWGSSWRSQVLFAILYEISDNPEREKEVIEQYARFVSHLKDQSLLDAYDLKPLIDGKALSKALSVSPGPWMKEALDVVMAWQLLHPNETDPSKAIEAVRDKQSELSAQLAHHFLALTIRPLFEQRSSRSLGVTAGGRKDTCEVSTPKFRHHDEKEALWKSDAYALDILQWVLRSLNKERIEKEWPLLIPPILAIMDDPSPSFQTQGCILIRLLLEATPSSLLKKTGLFGIFEQALKPCLLSLPTLTPEDESVRLLSEAYPALILLATKNPVPQSTKSKSLIRGVEISGQEKVLDDLFRNGILAGFMYAGEKVKIAEVLLAQLRSILTQLGIASVKHLKHILPLLSRILSEPLGLAYSPLLLSAAKTLQAVILNSWPRMTFHRNEVLQGTVICWLRVKEEGEGKYAELEQELETVVKMLVATIDGEVDWRAEFKELEDADGRLTELFDASRDMKDKLNEEKIESSSSKN